MEGRDKEESLGEGEEKSEEEGEESEKEGGEDVERKAKNETKEESEGGGWRGGRKGEQERRLRETFFQVSRAEAWHTSNSLILISVDNLW